MRCLSPRLSPTLLLEAVVQRAGHLWAQPEGLVRRLCAEFYDDLKKKQFSVADVNAEVTHLITRRASRGGTLSKVVLFVDELNCLSTSAVGASICAALKMDIRPHSQLDLHHDGSRGRGVGLHVP